MIFFGGIILFGKIPKLEDPYITIREALVVAKNPGMPVDKVERLITRPIEEKIRSMGEVDDIKDSTSKVGESILHVTIKDEVPAEDLPHGLETVAQSNERFGTQPACRHHRAHGERYLR